MRKKGNVFAPGSSLFSPSIIRGMTGDHASVVNITAASLSGSTQSTTSSFRYDPPGAPIKSTQQLPIDWSKFENHTFFNSAEAKVNTAFDIIINSYPFDGTRAELLEFFDRLTGYEKHVYDIFPKSLGFLNFSGSGEPSGGSYVSVRDSQGAVFPSLAKSATGKKVLDPGAGSISYDFHLSIPTGSSQGNQVVMQRLRDSTFGITLAVSSTLSTDPSWSLLMIVSSGSSHISSSMSLSKGEFQHVCATYDARDTYNQVRLHRNGKIVSETSKLELGDPDYDNSLFLIGSGSNHLVGSWGSVSPGLLFDQTFSGSIDELRVYHGVRSSSEIKKFSKRNVFSDSDLKLYYKFNEATGSYTSNSIAIDSSGNGLHGTINNFSESLRNVLGVITPVAYETPEESPVLFPTHTDVVSLNQLLLSSASDYDVNNPNMITKLIPRHYLEEASLFEGFGQNNELGDIDDDYGSNVDFPGGGRLGSAQIIASILFVWAKHFDEIKMFLDQFGRQKWVDPVTPGTIADAFLPQLAQTYGLYMPELFSNATYGQFFGRETIDTGAVLSDNGLQYVQNQIWRRILSDIVEITRSKGTLHSIKSLIRDMGINPDSNFRFREFGGSRTGRLSDQRIKRSTLLRALDFSGSFAETSGVTNVQGIPVDRPFFKSPGLLDGGDLVLFSSESVVRVEPGYPLPGELPIYDRILTSGSWTYEATYKMTSQNFTGFSHPVTSSLVRFFTSGTDTPSGLLDSLYLNLLAFSGSLKTNTTSSLSLVFRDTWDQTTAPRVVLPLTGVNIFDGDCWHISFGRERNDSFGSFVSSSWFIRAGRQSDGRLETYVSSSALVDDSVPAGFGTSVLTTWASGSSGILNMSGTMIHIGSQSVPVDSTLYGLGYDGAPNVEMDRSSFFGGRVLNLRFWTKALTDAEFISHTINPTSVGVDDATKNFNFVTNISGSWERMRLDLDFIQETSNSDSAGNITLVDMSQNEYNCLGTGFESSVNVLKPEQKTYSIINPYFDQSTSDNKIRVRSWLSEKNVNLRGGVLAPLHEIPEDEEPIDDTRFSIEVNAVQALNEDIIRIFSTLDAFDNYIGRPELQFSEDYPDLQTLRDVYFNRLTDKVNFKTFFEFFKWFDTTIGQLIESLVPRRTKFLGVNFVIEPHILERPKVRYNTFDLYLGPNDRNRGMGQILLQQLVGVLKRY